MPFLREYVAWHYGRALGEIFQISRNLLRHGYDFFSIPLLLKTWISPWYRMKERYGVWTDLEATGEALLGNFVLRIVGFLLRTLVLLFGAIYEILVLFGAVVVCVAWILFPIVIIVLCMNAISILF